MIQNDPVTERLRRLLILTTSEDFQQCCRHLGSLIRFTEMGSL